MKFLFLLLLVPSLAFGQAFTFSDLPFLSQGQTDWARRVVLNGGAMPSGNTIAAMETLRLGCIAAGLTNKIHALCVFVPDSVEACRTPLFYHQGYTNWGNSNFVSGDLNINGLKGNGSDKVLNTGVRSEDVFSPGNPPRGAAVIVTESSSNEVRAVMGQQDANGADTFALLISSGGDTEWIAGSVNPTYVTETVDFGRVGYVSGNVTTNVTTNTTVYVASPLESHKVLTNRQMAGNLSFPMPEEGDSIFVFTVSRDGTNNSPCSLRLSLAIITSGFTQAEDSAFWNLALACRQSLGGGTGDNIHDFNRKVVAFGGAAISTTTSNALRTFYGGLNTDGTLDLMVSVNCVVPDNLIAARVPVIWKAGSEVWTNFNFGATNLSTTGLQGNGTDKYLGTGVTPSTATRISNTSGGITGLISANPGTVPNTIMGGNPVTANVSTLLIQNLPLLSFRFWRNDLVNQNFLQATDPSPGATFTGWISGNRTAADAIAVYIANTGLAHQVFTNATGTQTGTATANTRALLAWANNNNGTPSGVGNHTMSFVAFHGGMTQTQSSNTYVRVDILRDALGGGSP